MDTALIRTENLTYAYYGEAPALNQVSVSIFPGEKIAVVGANGAGKSTFFLNLNGVYNPQAGEIYYKGKRISRSKADLMQLRKGVGIVFQDADNQIVASTVRGEVSFGPMNMKLPKEEVVRRVDGALEVMGLTDHKDRPPHYLSGGEKKRVSIADIIAMESEVFIFDEPTASLDPYNAEMLEGVLHNLANNGKTLLISTHDVDFAYSWADRVLVFQDGRIVADGTPVEIFTQEELLKSNHLKKPKLLQFYEYMVKQGFWTKEKEYPRSMDSLMV